jgi:hypothetical protein
MTWKLDSGWPPKNCRATTTARATAAPGVGRRSTRSAVHRSHGRRAQTFVCGQATQTRKNRLKAKTTPASSAPPKRMPSARPSRYVPIAATKTLRAAARPSDHQKPST